MKSTEIAAGCTASAGKWAAAPLQCRCLTSRIAAIPLQALQSDCSGAGCPADASPAEFKSCSKRENSLLKLLCYGLLLICCSTSAQAFRVERLNQGEPIISKRDFALLGVGEDGGNINGPSVIRVPDWIPLEERADPQARYYMYFAHHKGSYIRMAWAPRVEGPWQLYQADATVPDGRRGVLDMGVTRELPLGNGLTIIKHIASPEVHVDDESKRIIMYFHGPVEYEGQLKGMQKTFVATSPWGLEFRPWVQPVILAKSYLRVLNDRGILQGLTGGWHYTAPDPVTPWVTPRDFDYDGDLWQKQRAYVLEFPESGADAGAGSSHGLMNIRHLALFRSGTTLYVFFTVIGHAPERILATRIDLAQPDWMRHPPQEPPTEILRPELTWEGADVALAASKIGAQPKLENALRDPFIFQDEGRLYLFYAGGGERAIGLAELFPVSIPQPAVGVGPADRPAPLSKELEL